MRGEGDACDLKIDYDPTDSKAKVELVKDLVALANSGGGQIRFGYTETHVPGVRRTLLRELDGAKLTDLANKYVSPATVHVSHAVEDLHADDRIGIIVTIAPCGKYPLVFNREGDHSGGSTPVFRKGDIYIRHGAKSERANFQDLMWIIDKAVESSRGELMRRIDQLARLPEGYTVKFIPPAGDDLDEPNALLATVVARRSQDPSVLLTGRDLLWCWTNRDDLEFNDTNADLLVRSALRRTPTVFLWLTKIHDRTSLVANTLLTTLDDPDRDKSDAARALLEVATLMVPDMILDKLVSGLQTSRYAHFREAVRHWTSRDEFLTGVIGRLRSAKLDGASLMDLDKAQLLKLSNDLASSLLQSGKSLGTSRSLSDIGRILFLRTIGRI